MNIDLEHLVGIAEAAGKAIMEIYARDFEVTEKDDKSPLTEADLASHRLIVEALSELQPQLPILSEESADIPYSERSRWLRYWLVDPLDGTREFVKRNGEFTVNIALVESGRATCGVVHVPVSGASYYGCVGQGAWKKEPGRPTRGIRVARQRRHPLRIAGSRSHAGDSLKRFLDRVGPHEIMSMGSSLKLCLVAEGEADIYPRLGPTSEWDTAAAQAVVEAAGGFVTDLDMQALRYNRKDSLLNPHFLVFGDENEDWSCYL
jgi:3'(2'), 5'-bisphosphate nucleotidase